MLIARLLKRKKGTTNTDPGLLEDVRCKTPYKTTSLPIQHHDVNYHFFRKTLCITQNLVHLMLPTLHTPMTLTETSPELVTSPAKKQVINKDDEAFDTHDLFNIDILAKIAVAKPQINKTQDPLHP